LLQVPSDRGNHSATGRGRGSPHIFGSIRLYLDVTFGIICLYLDVLPHEATARVEEIVLGIGLVKVTPRLIC